MCPLDPWPGDSCVAGKRRKTESSHDRGPKKAQSCYIKSDAMSTEKKHVMENMVHEVLSEILSTDILSAEVD